MKIFGHPHIPSPNFRRIHKLDDIDVTLASDILWWKAEEDLDRELARFCFAHQVCYAVWIQSINDLLIYAHLGAKYCITPPQNAPRLQAIIKEYLLDTLLLCPIQKENEMESLALGGIDGVIFGDWAD